MKEKLKKGHNKVYVPMLVASIMSLLLALMVLLYTPLNPTPKYNELEETVAIVDYFHIVHHTKTSNNAILLTTDGNKFYITGKYKEKELYEKLLPGVTVQIKYYEGKGFYIKKMNLTKEIIVGNDEICTYKNTDFGNTVGCTISSCFLFCSSTVFFLSWKKSIKDTSNKKKSKI